MNRLKILNSKEKKQLLEILKKQWAISEKSLGRIAKEYVFLEAEKKGRIYIANSSISKIDDKKLRLDSIGLYFASRMKDGIRLSIEGSQIIGKDAKENIVELTAEEAKEWMQGNNIIKNNEKSKGFVIVKHKDNFMGCGKIVDNKILNYIPKARRIN